MTAPGVGEVGEHQHPGSGQVARTAATTDAPSPSGRAQSTTTTFGREGGHQHSRLGDAVGRTDGLDARLCGEHVDEAVGNHALAVDHQNLHGAENS